MASGGRRRRKGSSSSSRPKAKKRTRYLSLSRIIIKAKVQTPEADDCAIPASSPPSTPLWEEEDDKAGLKKEEDDDKVGVKEEEEDGSGGEKPQQQAEPFAPLHHEASTLFAAFPAPSLSDILGASSSSAAGGEASPSPSPSASPAGFTGGEEEDLARRALRGRERWVYCCSSTSSPSTTTTTSSSPCSSSAASTGASAAARSLLLKLDYEEILAAWADRGSLYIDTGPAPPKQEPESEPDLDDVLVEEEMEAEPPQQPPAAATPACAWRWSTAPGTERYHTRAESLRRYREKRRKRLFAHRIRYEVRHVNAVRRPRFKGRFIREHEEI